MENLLNPANMMLLFVVIMAIVGATYFHIADKREERRQANVHE